MARFDVVLPASKRAASRERFPGNPRGSAARESVRRLKDKGVRLWLSAMAKG